MDKKLQEYYRDIPLEELKQKLTRRLSEIPPTMEYVRNLILDAKMLLRILLDPDFDLKEEARRDFVGALLFLIEKKSRLPLIGLWEHYKLLRYVKEKHKDEIERYFSTTKHYIANYF
ncbi:hypothetical protein [Thermocrinis minervae]|uniref:Uncharacterized protein n=1 Tax=Thermocrinis minervae TaxID=381751 RepID=A0A1M6RCP0_9AQUI|nr:hypothetical protein [Thermocrinis minervae]SHK30221.1 hypothetical protein SAMN05444391_0594 [Thermocrinis minervae]